MALKGFDLYKWIQFQCIRSTGKTDVWQIAAKDKGPTLLGEIKWFGRWRSYAFFPYNDTVFESQCLSDIAQFCVYRTQSHRLALTQRKNNVASKKK